MFSYPLTCLRKENIDAISIENGMVGSNCESSKIWKQEESIPIDEKKEKKNHVENHEKIERKWGKVWPQKKMVIR